MMFNNEIGDSFLTKWKVRYREQVLQLAKSQNDTIIDRVLEKFDGGDGEYLEISSLINFTQLQAMYLKNRLFS